jgi:hypothetical protein
LVFITWLVGKSTVANSPSHSLSELAIYHSLSYAEFTTRLFEEIYINSVGPDYCAVFDGRQTRLASTNCRLLKESRSGPARVRCLVYGDNDAQRESACAVLSVFLVISTGCNQPPASLRDSSSPVASVPGPVPGTRLTEEYVRRTGAMAYLWGWPLVNVHNREVVLRNLPGPGLMGGITPMAPPNQLSMLRDYIEPAERVVACPNQDVL